MSDTFLAFDRGQPFFSHVSTFMVAIAACPAMFNAANPMGFSDDQFIAIEGLGTTGKHIRPKEVYDFVQQGNVTMRDYLVSVCASLANSAYEAVRERNDRSPEFEVLRHIRNAASHRNRFVFTRQEPTRAAAWRHLSFDSTKRGQINPLYGRPCFGALLGPTELVDLLWDLQRKLAA